MSIKKVIQHRQIDQLPIDKQTKCEFIEKLLWEIDGVKNVLGCVVNVLMQGLEAGNHQFGIFGQL